MCLWEVCICVVLVLYIDGGAAVTAELMMRETYQFSFSYIRVTVRAYSSFSHFSPINKHTSVGSTNHSTFHGTGLNVHSQFCFVIELDKG